MAASTQNNAATIQEYPIRVPKNAKKKYHVMRFNSTLNVEFPKWNQVKMERENNLKEFKGTDEEIPKFGAGSEFGREQREEARRKKHGIVSRSYKVEDQPWILKVGGKMGKKFKGIREGGVSENASFYIFTHAPDGAIEAYPLDEWYNFQPIQRYKALSAEEAEEEFGRRNKVLNYFSFMMRRRLRNEDEIDGDDGEEGIVKGKSSGKGKGKAAKGDLTISEMDEWVDSDEDDSEEENEEKDNEDDPKPKKNKGKKGQDDKKKKKKKKASDDEAFEESDDGDEEGREVDYISDSSDSDSDHDEKVNKEMKGVAEEDALRKLLTSDEEEDEEEKKEESEAEENKENPPKGDKEEKKKDKKKQKKKKKEEANVLNDSSSDYSSSSSDSDNEASKKNGKGKDSSSGNNSRSATPVLPDLGDDRKRIIQDALDGNPSKKARLENFSSASSSGLSYLPYGAAESGITEDAVRRYLMRKPMTTTELLQKFKSKKTGLTSEQLVNIMTQILKKINPVKQTIKGKMYLSLKA